MNHQSRTEQKIEEIADKEVVGLLKIGVGLEELGKRELEELIEEEDSLEGLRKCFFCPETLSNNGHTNSTEDLCRTTCMTTEREEDLLGKFSNQDLGCEIGSERKSVYLRQMRLERGLTQHELAEEASKFLPEGTKFCNVEISAYERISSPPYYKAQALADFFDVNIETLFSNGLCKLATHLEEKRHQLQRRCCPETKCKTEDFYDVLKEVLETLTKKEEEVIRMRYGIGDEELTLDEISEKYDLTRERIRQIEEKALKKLRHPSRSRYLVPYLED